MTDEKKTKKMTAKEKMRAELKAEMEAEMRAEMEAEAEEMRAEIEALKMNQKKVKEKKEKEVEYYAYEEKGGIYTTNNKEDVATLWGNYYNTLNKKQLIEALLKDKTTYGNADKTAFMKKTTKARATKKTENLADEGEDGLGRCMGRTWGVEVRGEQCSSKANHKDYIIKGEKRCLCNSHKKSLEKCKDLIDEWNDEMGPRHGWINDNFDEFHDKYEKQRKAINKEAKA